ncbi:unnamed protein product, partial [Prorocentrum cordatum]
DQPANVLAPELSRNGTASCQEAGSDSASHMASQCDVMLVPSVYKAKKAAGINNLLYYKVERVRRRFDLLGAVARWGAELTRDHVDTLMARPEVLPSFGASGVLTQAKRDLEEMQQQVILELHECEEVVAKMYNNSDVTEAEQLGRIYQEFRKLGHHRDHEPIICRQNMLHSWSRVCLVPRYGGNMCMEQGLPTGQGYRLQMDGVLGRVD